MVQQGKEHAIQPGDLSSWEPDGGKRKLTPGNYSLISCYKTLFLGKQEYTEIGNHVYYQWTTWSTKETMGLFKGAEMPQRQLYIKSHPNMNDTSQKVEIQSTLHNLKELNRLETSFPGSSVGLSFFQAAQLVSAFSRRFVLSECLSMALNPQDRASGSCQF